jgi:glutamyl-tRNA reductase
MRLLAVGCNYRTAPVAMRERLAFDKDRLPQALDQITVRFDCEAVILSTCNRVELYLGRVPDAAGGTVASSSERAANCRDALDAEDVTRFLAEFHSLAPGEVRPHLYVHQHADAVHHLFKVAASLDSLIVGEGQIAGQVKEAYEQAQQAASVGQLLHTLFQHARQVAKRVRTETGIARGHVSVSSAAVDYVRQVFDHFGDKTILVIGAGKMGELTLRHLKDLHPRRILVTNRSPEKAAAVAHGCNGEAAPFELLDESLAQADIVLSTTGSPELIVDLVRWEGVLQQRTARDAGPVVILDIAVPRDFDPRIHDGDRTCLFNIDDLNRIRDATLADRLKHVAPAEAIVNEEARRFLTDWQRRRTGPVIARLTQDLDAKREAALKKLRPRLNGKLGDDDLQNIEGAFRLFQNQILHGPISALAEEVENAPAQPHGHSLLDALRKLFRLKD